VLTPVLKAPGFSGLKLEYDEPLSNFAFNFNLRRYTVVCIDEVHERSIENELLITTVGRCRLTVSKPMLIAPMVSALETIIS